MLIDDGGEKGECKFANCNRDSADNCKCGDCEDDGHGLDLLYSSNANSWQPSSEVASFK